MRALRSGAEGQAARAVNGQSEQDHHHGSYLASLVSLAFLCHSHMHARSMRDIPVSSWLLRWNPPHLCHLVAFRRDEGKAGCLTMMNVKSETHS